MKPSPTVSDPTTSSISVNEIAPWDLRLSPPQGHHECSELHHLMGQQPYHQVLQNFRAGHHMSPIHCSRSPRHISHHCCSPPHHCSPSPWHPPPPWLLPSPTMEKEYMRKSCL